MEDSECIVPEIPLAIQEDDTNSLPSVCSSLDHRTHNLYVPSETNPKMTSSSSSSAKSEAQLSCSLQDLITSFDHNVSDLLKNLDGPNNIALQQIRSPEEVMSESEVWWTLTGNYGNLPPIDFNNSQIIKRQIDALGLQPTSDKSEDSTQDIGFYEKKNDEEEDELRNKLDLHCLVFEDADFRGLEKPPVTADQVIEEIDEIITMMQGDYCTENHESVKTEESSADSMYSSVRSPMNTELSSSSQFQDFRQRPNFSEEALKNLTVNKLLSLHTDLEQLVHTYNVELVNELARRDEQEYEKEVKNKIITLVVEIQEKRKNHHSEENKRKSFTLKHPNQSKDQFLSAVIPFNETNVQNQLRTSSLEYLNRILQAILDENPQLPNLLTEYILTVVCPATF